MATIWRYVSPKNFVTNTSAAWFDGVRSSGTPMLQYGANRAANTNMILQLPIESYEVDSHGKGRYLQKVHLSHFVSAASAGVTPLISAGVKFYEVVHSGNKVAAAAAASALFAQLPNAGTSAGFVNDASGTAWTPAALSAAGVAIASMWTSGNVETFTAPQAKALGVGEIYTHDYIPRLANTGLVMEISASVGASAVWEIYGAVLEFK